MQKPDGNVAPVFACGARQERPRAVQVQEPTGGGGTRMHHKFVVIDFDKPTARVYLGSYNFSIPADENERREPAAHSRPPDRGRPTSSRRCDIFDHYHFRVAQQEAKKARKKLQLARPPRKAGEKPWWAEDYTNARKIRDRELFA